MFALLPFFVSGVIAEPRVQLDSGAVVHGFSIDAAAQPIHAFEGLRFAEPPVGQLRFASPRRTLSARASYYTVAA